MKVTKAHCMFEQSGTFKNEFIKLGIPAEDYDILNDYGQTDHVIDLYHEIDEAYADRESLFDKIKEDELIFAFFPCTRFQEQHFLLLTGQNYQQKNWNITQKLEYAMKFHRELDRNYELVSRLVIVCLRKNIRLIIENPYTQPHYLTNYWAVKPAIIDKDRRERGDKFKKPTQYFFINCNPSDAFVFEPQVIRKAESIGRLKGSGDKRQAARSEIAPEYANRFIREFILDEETL